MSIVDVVQPEEAASALSPAEKKDFAKLEKDFEQGQRKSISALREIRERKLYRAEYETFDSYMAGRWHRTRQWATQQINWLRRSELLEGLAGKDSYHLTVDDAQALHELENHPEEFVRAVVQAEKAADQAGTKRTKQQLQDAVHTQQSYLSRKARYDHTFDEFLALSALGRDRCMSPNLVLMASEKAEKETRPLVDCLVEVCDERRGLPLDEHLLGVARGEKLAALVGPLSELQDRWEAEMTDSLAEDSEEEPDEVPDVGVAADGDALDSSDEVVDCDSDPDELDAEEPPVHETESVLRLLVKINAALGLAASMSVADVDRDQIEAEIKQAHTLLDQIEVGV